MRFLSGTISTQHNLIRFFIPLRLESRVQQKAEEEYEETRKLVKEQEQHLRAERKQAQAYHEENMKEHKETQRMIAINAEKTHRQLAITSQQLATLSAQVGELIAMLHTSKENISIG